MSAPTKAEQIEEFASQIGATRADLMEVADAMQEIRIFETDDHRPFAVEIENEQDEEFVSGALEYAKDCEVNLRELPDDTPTENTIPASEIHTYLGLDRDS